MYGLVGEAPEAGPNMVIEKGRVFKDLPALKRWLQVFIVIKKETLQGLAFIYESSLHSCV